MRTYDASLGVWVDDGVGVRLDGWENALTGLGTARDKSAQAQYNLTYVDTLLPEICADLVAKDDIAARIASARPNEMFRKGYELRVDGDTDQSVAQGIAKAAEELAVDQHVLDALIWGGGLGGALLVLGVVDSGTADQPLDETSIRRIEGLSVVDRRFAKPSRWYQDPTKANYMRPEAYWLTNPDGGVNPVTEIHESRVIRFGGGLTDALARRRMYGWDYSILQRPWEKMKAFDQAFRSVGHMLTDMSQAVMGVDGLFNMIAAGRSDDVATRMQALDMTRSNARMILIDKTAESFEYKARQFSGVPEILQNFMLLLASAAEMPVSILMGRSPAGLNATGESDFQAWYDVIAADQKRVLLPKLARLYRLLTLAKDGPTRGREVDVSILFRPLKEMTEKERADLEYVTAQKDALYIDKEVATPEEIAMSRFGGGEWSPETVIDLDARAAAQKAGASFDPYPADPEVPPPGATPPVDDGATPPEKPAPEAP